MKKVLIAIIVLLITLSCSFSANQKQTATSEAKLSETTVLPTQPTSFPTIEPTIPRAKKAPTATLIPSFTPRPTASPTPAQFPVIQEKVRQYGNPKLDELVAEFSKNDVIYLDDFSDIGNKLKYIYNFPLYEFEPRNFIALSRLNWSHSTTSITKSAAGCGFIFFNNSDNQRYYAVVTNDSNVRIIHLYQGGWSGIAHKKYSQSLDLPNGEADFIVIVKDDLLVVAVNGEIVINQTFDWRSSGSFGYSILSGTNNPNGTRCDFTDTALIIED